MMECLENHGGHLRALGKMFFSIEEVEVRCIHNMMVVDTTKRMAQFVHMGLYFLWLGGLFCWPMVCALKQPRLQKRVPH